MTRGRTRTPEMRKAVSKRLKMLRKYHELGQTEFAAKANVLRTAYANWEKGLSMPDISAGISICTTYKVTLDWIYMGDPSGLKVDMWEKMRHQSAPDDIK